MPDTTPPVRTAIATEPGKPAFLDHPEMDRVIAMVMRLAMEVSVLRDRLDTHEQLGKACGIGPEDIEAFEADATVQAERAARRQHLIEGLMLDMR